MTKTKFINEQVVDISVADMPGTVKIPRIMTPKQVDIWWKGANEPDDDETEFPFYHTYESRKHLVIKLDHPLADEIDEDGRIFPDLMMAVIAATDRLVDSVSTRPTLPAPSANGAKAKE